MGEELNVNDGKGLYDNIGLIDSLIVECSDLVKSLTGGQYVQFCVQIVEMVQKLGSLRNGVKNDSESLRRRVDELQNLIDEYTGQKKEDDTNV